MRSGPGMRVAGAMLAAVVLACGCAEKARYPKIDCALPPANPEMAQCTESSKIVGALHEADMADVATQAQETQVAAAVQASPWEGPCRRGTRRCTYFAHDRRDDPPATPEPVDVGEVREYARQFLNGLRAQKGIGPLAHDAELDAFAQRRAERYRHDQYALLAPACGNCAELHGPAEGMWPMPAEQQVDTILSVMLREGPGQTDHDLMLSPAWHRAGVGLVNPGTDLYFIVVLAE